MALERSPLQIARWERFEAETKEEKILRWEEFLCDKISGCHCTPKTKRWLELSTPSINASSAVAFTTRPLPRLLTAWWWVVLTSKVRFWTICLRYVPG